MSEQVMGHVSFSVTGSFVTETARRWLWEENKPWARIEEFLLSCMKGTNQTEAELKELAWCAAFGKTKFIGTTANGSFAMVDDDSGSAIRYVEQLHKTIADLKKENEELEERYDNLVSRIEEEGYTCLLAPRDDFLESFSPQLRSYIDQMHIEEQHDDNYGWLEPNGVFHPVDFADHQEWAWQTIQERGWKQDFAVSDVGGIYASGDFLVQRGWVLLHNPQRGVAQVQCSPTRRLTKAQREFLFGYFTDRTLHDMAKEYLPE